MEEAQFNSGPSGGTLIYEKLVELMGKVTPIGKGRKNQEQGYSFRGIDDMYNELHPLFADAGVFVTCSLIDVTDEQRTTQRGSILNVVKARYKITFFAKDGSNLSVVQRGEAQDSGDKASNKAASAALKYALMQTLLIPTAEIKDAEADDVQPQEQQRTTPRPPAPSTKAAATKPAAAPPTPPKPQKPNDLAEDLNQPQAKPVSQLPKATDDEVSRCIEAMRKAGNTDAWDAIRQMRTITKDQHSKITQAVNEILDAQVAAKDQSSDFEKSIAEAPHYLDDKDTKDRPKLKGGAGKQVGIF